MDFSIPEEIQMLQRTVHKLVYDEAIPLESEVLKYPQGEAPPELIEPLRARTKGLGIWNLDVPEEYGGAGLSAVANAIIREEIHRTVTPVPIGGRVSPILYQGNEEQKERFLLPVLRGEQTSAFAQTEPNAGSDPSAMETTAVRDGDDWVINGRKIFITDGHKADSLQVIAVTDKEKRQHGGITCFMVESNRPGFEVVRRIPIMGWEAPAELSFTDVRVPDSNRIGEIGQGFRLAQSWISAADRLGLGPMALGRSERSLEMAVENARNRVTFGKPLAQRQAIQWMIADSTLEIHLLRTLTHHAAWKADSGEDFRIEASMVRLYASETQSRVVDRAIQILGGYGLSDDLCLARWYRTVRVNRINGGSSEIQRFILARHRIGGIDLRD